MNVIVLLNGGAGTGPTGVDGVREALRAARIEGDVHCVHGADLHAAAKAAAAQGVDAVVAGGGDGTVSAVAGALAGGETPLGVLPLGTLNHFAKDCGIPLDLEEAALVLAAGHVRRLDLGRVNDRVFINNASLGVYAKALMGRDARRELGGTSKWPAMLLAAWKVFRRSPLLRVRLEAHGEKVWRKTPLVFVGNNTYELEILRVGKRARLDDGVLSLYVATATSRWGMLKLGLRAAGGRLAQSRDFETRSVTSVTVETRRAATHVAVDGEIVAMRTPLEFSVWPEAIPVMAPADVAPGNDAPAGRG
jgi:diacylglycerol kinase family enzyme